MEHGATVTVGEFWDIVLVVGGRKSLKEMKRRGRFLLMDSHKKTSTAEATGDCLRLS